MIQHFLDTFIPTHTYKTELRVSAQEIRQFLLENNYSLSFRAFNEQVGCLGRTTHNLYAYSVPYLLTLTQDKQDEGLRRDKKNLKTLNYYGSKRRWAKEWNILLTLAYNLNCSNLVDCFAGSGFISLEASKLNIFNKIYLNEFSILVYNYLLTLQDDDTFKNFVAKISRRNFITKEGFEILKQEVYGLAGGVVYASTGRKRSLQTVNVEQAANYHLVNYFAYNGQGGYSSRKPLRTAGLEQTHNLLKNCSLSNYHYRKVMLQHIDDVNSLIVLDPPYLSKYREQANSYYVEFTDRQHISMLQLIKKTNPQAKVILCGYKDDENDLYSRYLRQSKQEWHCVRFKRGGQLDNKTGGREHIWCNFDIDSLIKYQELFEVIY